jgi:hypothetical protein
MVPLALYGGQLALNLAWSPLFFGAKRLDWALADLTGGRRLGMRPGPWAGARGSARCRRCGPPPPAGAGAAPAATSLTARPPAAPCRSAAGRGRRGDREHGARGARQAGAAADGALPDVDDLRGRPQLQPARQQPQRALECCRGCLLGLPGAGRPCSAGLLAWAAAAQQARSDAAPAAAGRHRRRRTWARRRSPRRPGRPSERAPCSPGGSQCVAAAQVLVAAAGRHEEPLP